MSEEILVEVDGLCRYYADNCAVNNLSFNVRRGEILGFLGPNGAGKSTTMQIISGVLAPSEGHISICGHDISKNPGSAKHHIGFLPEQPPLYPELSVDEYLTFCAKLHKIEKSKIANAVENSKKRCGLQTSGNRLIGNLSKGYQQRIGIAQAIIHSPAVVILDEPTSGLDPNQIIEIRELISELGDDHSVILSTHILSEVQASCDRVLIINYGKLILDENIGSLQKDTANRTFTVALKNPPLIEELENINGINEVTCLDKYHFRIACENRQNTAQVVADISAKSGWGLYELIPESDSLENIFIRLTGGEQIGDEQV